MHFRYSFNKHTHISSTVSTPKKDVLEQQHEHCRSDGTCVKHQAAIAGICTNKLAESGLRAMEVSKEKQKRKSESAKSRNPFKSKKSNTIPGVKFKSETKVKPSSADAVNSDDVRDAHNEFFMENMAGKMVGEETEVQSNFQEGDQAELLGDEIF